jgi:hypothetical protein
VKRESRKHLAIFLYNIIYIKMLSKREKQIRQSIDTLFTGLDDEALKQIMLACALGYSEEEKEKICEDLRKVNEENLQEITSRYQLTAEESIPTETKVIQEEEKQSSDNVE